MNASEYILSILRDKDRLSKEDHSICRSLMTAMPKDELTKLSYSGLLDWYLQTQAENLLRDQKSTNTQKEHNLRWSDYLLSLKARKNVQKSRDKLRQSFDYYDWRAQKRILHYFLSNGLKIDRVWAFQKILDDYSLIEDTTIRGRKKWIELILNLWLEYRDVKAAWIIVKHFPLGMVESNATGLENDCGYQAVALRLGIKQDYDIDLKRLSDIDQLYVLAKLHRHVEDNYAESLLYLTILTSLSDPDELLPHNVTSMMSIDKVRLAIWCLGQMGKEETIIRFYECDRAFREAVAQEWSGNYSQNDFWYWVRNKLSRFFPYVYRIQQSILEDMMHRNPALRELIKTLNLKLV